MIRRIPASSPTAPATTPATRVGPTADGFETYGVTGVALIAFLALALAANPTVCATLIIWLFTMRALMIVTSLVSYFLNEGLHEGEIRRQERF